MLGIEYPPVRQQDLTQPMQLNNARSENNATNPNFKIRFRKPDTRFAGYRQYCILKAFALHFEHVDRITTLVFKCTPDAAVGTPLLQRLVAGEVKLSGRV